MPNLHDTRNSSLSDLPNHLIRHVTLRQLQVFEAVYRLGSFTRAAEELFLTQPTLSTQIRKLSDVVGVPLLEHVGRNVQPTEAGTIVYHACTSMFETLIHLDTDIANLKGLKSGRLRLCVVTTAKYLAPEMLGKFSRDYPGVDLVLNVTNREKVIERMQANIDDLYIMGQVPNNSTDLQTYTFSPNPLVVMAPTNHPLVGKKNIPLKVLLDEPFIIREPGSGIRDATLKLFDSRGLKPAIKMELSSNEAIKYAVVSGLGLSVLSLHTITLEGMDGPLAILDVEGFPILRNWYIVHPKDKELSLVAQKFLDFAVQYEPVFRKHMVELWPALEKVIND
ncbi:MAG: LysR family transcriptional regulator [Gammaproteobacteria bacterium]|nr:LysR family transcriptional regulator [Gammaproteobacteria bacterium]